MPPRLSAQAYQTWNVIDADTQHLGIVAFELEQVKLVRRHLVRSDRCPGQWKERNQYIVLAPVLAEPNRVIEVALELKIRGFHTNSQFHLQSPSIFSYFHQLNSNIRHWLCQDSSQGSS